MKNFCIHLREHGTKIINYEKKEIIPFTTEEKKLHRTEKVCNICKKNLVLMSLEIIVITQENIEELFMIFAI